jgi:hypothetical protein
LRPVTKAAEEEEGGTKTSRTKTKRKEKGIINNVINSEN